MGECIGLAAFTGCVVSIMGLTCMSQDRCSHQLCQYLYQGLVALLQVQVSGHHPPSDCLLCQILVCSQTAENQPFTKPCFHSNRHLPWQTDNPPSPPTHSVDLIQETTNTPTKLFPHRGLVCLISADYIKTPSGVEFRRGRDRQSFTVTWFHISVAS